MKLGEQAWKEKAPIQKDRNKFCPKVGGGSREDKVVQIMYTYVSKCKNDTC
jgi:hypothetical protein